MEDKESEEHWLKEDDNVSGSKGEDEGATAGKPTDFIPGSIICGGASENSG